MGFGPTQPQVNSGNNSLTKNSLAKNSLARNSLARNSHKERLSLFDVTAKIIL